MTWKNIWPPIFSFLILCLLFELLIRNAILSPLLFPTPTQVMSALSENFEDFKKALFETSSAVMQGYLLSICFGLLIALLFSLNSFLRRSILPFAIFFQTVPIIAVAPLLVIYFGFGPPTVISATLIVSIFPIIANTLVGLDNIDQNYLDLFTIYRASNFKKLFKLRLPLAYLSIFSGIKISAGLAVIGAVAGEFVAGGGLGAMIDAARTQQRVDIVFAAIILLSCLGLFLILLLNLVNLLIQKWRPLVLQQRDST